MSVNARHCSELRFGARERAIDRRQVGRIATRDGHVMMSSLEAVLCRNATASECLSDHNSKVMLVAFPHRGNLITP
jgi:hypothetical protein